MTIRAGALALAAASAVFLASCADGPLDSTSEQAVINVPLPSNLNLILNAKTTVTVGPFTQVLGDVGSTGLNGSVLFDVGASQGFGNNTLAMTVAVRTSASVGSVFGNDITVDGFAAAQTLGLDPGALPTVPGVTVGTAGTTNITLATNQARQLCPGQYGTLSLGANSTLNLNGGVYQVNRLNLAEGARLEPSEPVVILVTGSLTTARNARIVPSGQSLNPMSAPDIRIEVAGAATIGEGSQLIAHLLVPNGKLTLNNSTSLTGAAWAKTIAVGSNSFIVGQGVFAALAPTVPPPCNDNSACTADQCVGSGTSIAFCRNTPAPSGTSCGDGNACNGEELCNATGTCQPGTTAANGTACPDGDLCNGDETCNGAGTCVSGTPPVVGDDSSCTADACDAEDGVVHIPVPDGTTCNGTGTCTAGVCSVVAHTLFTINDFTGHLERIDPDTLVITDIGPLGVPYAFGDCMFNPSDSTLYMVDGRGDRGLYRVNLSTGQATLIGQHNVSAMEGLAFHTPTGTIFGTSFDVTNLFTLNATTGAATTIGSVSGHRFQGLAFDTKRSVLTAYDGVQIFSVNVANAALTLLASTPTVFDFGMTYDPVIDRFWVVDTFGQIMQFDPNQGFARTFFTTLPSGGRTCIASVPIGFAN
jgi:hypothetical protein